MRTYIFSVALIAAVLLTVLAVVAQNKAQKESAKVMTEVAVEREACRWAVKGANEYRERLRRERAEIVKE